MDNRPVVLLDVDGVINWIDTGTARAARPADLTDHSPLNGYAMRISSESAALARAMATHCEVWWCTTWRHDANRFVSPLVGLPDDLPVVLDDADSLVIDWKPEAVDTLAQTWRAEGRPIYWIEDFTAMFDAAPIVEGVIMVDTTETGRLTWDVLPVELLAAMDAPPGVISARLAIDRPVRSADETRPL